MEETMKNLLLGVLLGSVLTGTVVSAGTFYDSKGKVVAPQGSQQQFDYFRQRQLFLDTAAQRRLAEQDRLTNPCGK
jgi:hypothetical protein